MYFNKGYMMQYYQNGGIPVLDPALVEQEQAAEQGLPVAGPQNPTGGPSGAPVGQPIPNPTPPTQALPKRRSLMDMVDEYYERAKGKRSPMAPVDAAIPPARGVDTIPARLAEGEGVLNREATAMLGGPSFINQANAEGLAMRNMGIDPNPEPHGYIAPGGDGTDGSMSVTPQGEPVVNLKNGGYLNYFADGVANPQQPEQPQGNFLTGLTGGYTEGLQREADLRWKAAGLESPGALGAEGEATDEEKANKQILAFVQEGKKYVVAAAEAGDFVHGYGDQTLTDEEQSAVDAALDKVKSFFTGVASVAAGAFNQTARVREEALMKIAAKRWPESYTAFTKLQQVGENLALAYLPKLGPGPKTDTDLRVAREAVFNIRAPSNTWLPQLEATEARITGVVQVPNAAEPNPATPPNTPPATEPQNLATGKQGESDFTLEGTMENLQGKHNYAPVATKIDKSLVPQDIIEFKPKKNRWVESDDGAFYIHYDAKRADAVLAAWYRATEVIPNG